MEEHYQDRTRVRVYTEQFIVTGDIAMFSDSRLTDFMVGAHPFIAITNAVVSGLDGQELFQTAFLNVQKEKIVLVMPEEMVKPR